MCYLFYVCYWTLWEAPGEKKGINLAELRDLKQNNISVFNVSFGALTDTEYWK